MSDQYDSILRALEPGTIITINNQPNVRELPSGELTVGHSKDDRTNVLLKESSEVWYRIRRDTEGDLSYVRVKEDGTDYQGKVITLEIVGIA